jgi:FlaA1/EpsC-like NDP-sugar epimerase
MRAAVLDGILVFISYIAAFSVRSVTASLRFTDSVPFILFVVATTIIVLYLFGAYYRIWAQCSGHEITLIFKAMATTSLFVVFADLVIQPRPLPLSVILVANALLTSGLVAIRYRSRLITGASWRWKAIWSYEFPIPSPKINVLIIGAGESGQAFAWRLKHRIQDHSYHLIGFIDDDPDKLHMYVEGCPILGTRSDLVRVADTYNVDLIVVALHNISGTDFREILTLCEQTKARIKVVPNVMAIVDATHNAPLLRDVEPEDLIGRKHLRRRDDVDFSAMTHKVILITGAAGSIGSELSRQILEYEPTRVILLDNNESGLHDLMTELNTRYPDIDLVPVLADITLRGNLELVFREQRPQVVFHAAAYKHVPILEYHPQEAFRVNIRGTIYMAAVAGETGVERFVFISTDKAVSPSSVMGATKRIGELILHALSEQADYPTLFTSVRFGNVLGSRGSVIPTFNRQIESGGPVTVTHSDMTRYFMSIPEAANLIIHAACLTGGDDIYMLQMGEVVRIVELAERMIRLHGLRPYQDIEIKYTGVRPGEKMHEELFDASEYPAATQHPDIMQLKTRAENFDTTCFLQQVEALMNSPSVSSADIFYLLDTAKKPQSGHVSQSEQNAVGASV